MDIRQLEYFRAIAECGSISEAARHLNLSQPPLSFQMKRLEEELQVRLFERGRREITLTPAGKLLYQRAGDLLSAADSAAREVSAAGLFLQLRLGTTPTVISIAAPCLSRFAGKHPEVRYELHNGNTYQLRELLKDGTIDAAFIRTPVSLSGLNAMTLQRDVMIAVFPKGQPAPETVSMEELAGRPLIIYRRYQQLILDAFYSRGLNPDIFCLCEDGRDAVLLAAGGPAAAIVPGCMSSSLSSEQSFARIQAEDLLTSILIAWRKDRKASGILASFMAEFSDISDKM